MRVSKPTSNRITFTRTEIKEENFLKSIRKNFIKKARSMFYRGYVKGLGYPPVRGIRYIIKTGYSKSYIRKLANRGIEAKQYNYFSIESEEGNITPARIRNELLEVLQNYIDNPMSSLENFTQGSDINSQDTRLKSVTINFLY